MTQSQMYHPTFPYTVLRKFGKYTIESHPITKELVVTDGWKADWICIYADGKWAHDGVFKLRKDVVTWLNTNAPKYFKE